MKPHEIIRQQDAQLRYYMHVDPDQLTDEERAIEWNNLLWIRNKEKKYSKFR